MKTTIIKHTTLAILLLLTVGFVGCDKSEEPYKDPYKVVLGKWKLIKEGLEESTIQATLLFTKEKKAIIEVIQSQSQLKEVFETDYAFKTRDIEGTYTLCFNKSYYFICKFYDDKMWLEDQMILPTVGPLFNYTFQRIKK